MIADEVYQQNVWGVTPTPWRSFKSVSVHRANASHVCVVWALARLGDYPCGHRSPIIRIILALSVRCLLIHVCCARSWRLKWGW